MSEELSKAERHKRGMERFRLYRILTLSFGFLTTEACCYASRSKELRRKPLEVVRHRVFNWVDRHLQVFHMPLPPVELKERLFDSFSDLVANQGRHPFTNGDPKNCPACGSQLVTTYNEPLVCERCMQPVLDALDELVRATTTLWTPEDLREAYLNALNSVDETA